MHKSVTVSLVSLVAMVSIALAQDTAIVTRNKQLCKQLGLTNAAAVAVLEPANYSNDAVITLCLANISHLAACSTRGLRPTGKTTTDAVVQYLKDPATPRNGNYRWCFEFIPLSQRASFRDDIEQSLNAISPSTPVWNSVCATKLAAGKTMADLTLDEMLVVMLVPEPQGNTTALKTQIKSQAIPYARKALRAEGKSFVVSTNGVNPLVAKLQPVVDALNAPCMAGLESALRGLGMSVADHDRAPLRAYAAKLQTDALSGDKQLTPPEQAALVIALGVKDYNQFVDLYNKGSN